MASLPRTTMTSPSACLRYSGRSPIHVLTNCHPVRFDGCTAIAAAAARRLRFSSAGAVLLQADSNAASKAMEESRCAWFGEFTEQQKQVNSGGKVNPVTSPMHGTVSQP